MGTLAALGICVVFAICLWFVGLKIAMGVAKFFWAHVGALSLLLGFIVLCLMMKVGG